MGNKSTEVRGGVLCGVPADTNSIKSRSRTIQTGNLIPRHRTPQNQVRESAIAQPIAGLEHTFVSSRGVEVQIQGISGQVDMHSVGSVNTHPSSSYDSVAAHLDLLLGDGDIQVLRLLEYFVANHVFGLRGVGAHLRLGLEGVFKLVVGEIGR